MRVAMKTKREFLPRFIRLKDAPYYLGMDKNRFNSEVRTGLREIRIGRRGVAFDRVDLDAVADNIKESNGRPAQKGGNKWDARHRQASLSGTGSGILTSELTAEGFARALELEALRKQKKSLP